MSISDVQIISAKTTDDLQAQVYALISDSHANWQPYGEPFTLGDRCCLMMVNGNIKIDTGSGAAPLPVTAVPQSVAPISGATLSYTLNSSLQTFLIAPAADLAALTINLFHGIGEDGSRMRIICLKNVTSVTIGGDAFGGPYANPTSLVADTMYEWEWNASTSQWWRVL